MTTAATDETLRQTGTPPGGTTDATTDITCPACRRLLARRREDGVEIKYGSRVNARRLRSGEVRCPACKIYVKL